LEDGRDGRTIRGGAAERRSRWNQFVTTYDSDGEPARFPDPLIATDGGQGEREVSFENPDFAYLFMAALRREASDAVARQAMVVPSASGPAILIDADALDRPVVRSLVNRLEGTVEGR
jgi:hypothetical protein